MKFLRRNYHIVTGLLVFLLIPSTLVFAQKKPRWYVSLGAGGTEMRNFTTTFKDIQNSTILGTASIDYQFISKPDFLVDGGVGLSGTFQDQSLWGWEIGLNVRSSGFRLTPELLDKTGVFPDSYERSLPEFGKTKRFRYWALHVPVSITYLPFEYVGFTLGADLYYQFSTNITSKESPYGLLGQAMGISEEYAPQYKHPFQFGAHAGIFAPINDRLRIDINFLTDITPRLSVGHTNLASTNYKFREMGLKFNTRYNLK